MAPALAPATNGAGPSALAEAIARHAEAQARLRALLRQRDDPSADPPARRRAQRDLRQAELDEEDAAIALDEATAAETATQRQRQAERARALEPEVRRAVQAYQESLEALVAGPFRDLVMALETYYAETTRTFPYAAELLWPGAFLKPEGATEDLVSYRRRWLREQKLLP